MKLGLQPPHPRWSHPRVVLDAHVDLDALAASVPATVDRISDVPGWPMYLNDRLGDCAEAASAHAVQAISAWTGTPVTPTDQDVVALYEAAAGYDPAQVQPDGSNPTDQGTNLQDLLRYWSANSWCGIELAGWAELRDFRTPTLRAALYYFGAVIAGVALPAGAMQQFQEGRPWTVLPGDHIEGGHAIVLEDVQPGMDMLHWVSWGQVQRSDQRWWRTYASEAWVPVLPQVLAHPPAGVNADSLWAEFRKLT